MQTEQTENELDSGQSRSNGGLAVYLEKIEREFFEKWASDVNRTEKLPLDRHEANGAYKDSRTYIAWYAWKARGSSVKPCRGIAHQGCDYLAVCGSICDKCGQAV